MGQHPGTESLAAVAQWDALVSFFLFLQLSSDCAGLNRQDRSLRYSGGPKTEPKHRAAWQSAVSNRSECTNVHSGHQKQNYTALAWRSPQMSIANIVIIRVTSISDLMETNTAALSPLNSPYSPVRSRPAPPSTAGRLEHKNGSISAGTTQNRVIRVVIRSHGGFELVVDRLVSCCRLLLICIVISLIVVPLDVGYCTLHSITCL